MPRLSIPELAASIARIGLLQNLIVILSADGETYEVVAGDRRLTALKLLAKKKRIPADYEVPCLLVADASARTVSLAENVQRENMHPPTSSRPSPRWSGRTPHRGHCCRLRRVPAGGAAPLEAGECLAAPHGRLSRQWRDAGTVDGPDHHRRPRRAGSRVLWCAGMAAQPVQAARAPDRARNRRRARAGALRRTEHLPAGRRRHPPRPVRGRRCRNLPDRYRSAGNAGARQAGNAGRGRARRGLGMGGGRAASGLRGTAGVPERPRHRREPTSREARRIASLESRLEKIDAELEEACDAEDEAKAEKLEQRRDQVVGELQDAEDALQGYAPEVREVAGAIVTIDRNGEAVIHRGCCAKPRPRRCARWKSCGAVSATPKAKPPTTSTRTPTTHPRPRACPIGWRSG